VIRSYVDALDAGDVDAAMALRCAKARIDDTSSAQFLAEVKRLRSAAGGHLRVANLRERPVRLSTASGGVIGEHEYSLRLRVAGGSSTAIDLTTVTEDGKPRVCGWSIAESFGLRDRLSTMSVTPLAAHVSEVKAVATGVTSELHLDVVDDGPTMGTNHEGVEGWTSAWRTGSFGGGRINVIRYESEESATKYAVDVLNTYAADSSSIFTPETLPTAIGLRYTGSAWTAIQPADLGPQIDVAVVVYDDVLVWMTASALDPKDDHSVIENLSKTVATILVQ